MRLRLAAVAALILAGVGAPAAAQPDDPGLVRYRGPIEHIFFHPLLPDPQYTLHRGTQPAEFNKWMVTAREFRAIVPQLYANDWVLVDLESQFRTVRTERGKVLKRRPLWLPPGKKPLVISIDDLNYPEYMVVNRLNARLVLDERGDIAAERARPDGTVVRSRRSEIVPILDRFVEQHPDFSIDGAKGTIALTGAEGILGYRTSGRGPRARRERERVTPIVARLRQTGWTFASHTFAHPDLGAVSLLRAQQDTDRWERYVQPLVGRNTRILVYPYGSPAGPATLAYLRRAGFRIFCTIGPSASLTLTDGYAVQSRVRVDGIALLNQPRSLTRFFDPLSVVDPIRPPL